MIYSVEISQDEDYLTKRLVKKDYFKTNKVITFEKGFNFVIGLNGSGKSTLLDILSISLAAKQGGYSKITSDYSYEYKQNPIKSKVNHCGRGIMYNNSTEQVGLFGGSAAFDDDFMSEGLRALMCKGSHGEKRIDSLRNILDVITSVKPFPVFDKSYLTKNTKHPYNFDPCDQASNDDPLTIIIDEPETGLSWYSLEKLYDLFDKNNNGKYQFIIATQNPLFLKFKDANFIELTEGYKNHVEQSLIKLVLT